MIYFFVSCEFIYFVDNHKLRGSALKPERMNFKTLIIIIFCGLIGFATTSSAQGNTILKELDVYQGTAQPFYLNSPYGDPQPKSFPMEGNEINLVGIDGNIFAYEYVPDPDFLGADGFSYEVIESPFPPNPSKTTYVFQINVIASMVNTNNDFVHLNSLEEVILDPLANDETSSSNLEVTVAQVLRGSAIVNEDLTITYTPVDENPDYIVYTVSDEFNTISSATIYLNQEYDLEEESTSREYTMASGNSEYIILPNSDLQLDAQEYAFGSLEQVNDFVYMYTADVNVEGSDVIRFTDANSNEYLANITIIEKYTDVGYVKDDVFYSASNTNLVFDVTENDEVDQYVIADYSDELYHVGDGVFSYTPPPYFKGIKTFFYTADDGFTEETGTIELVFNNYKPTNYFQYNLSTPQNQPRIIEYDVPLGTEYFEISTLPENGTVEVFTDDESVDVACEEGIQKVFALYTPNDGFVGADELTIRYCASDNNVCNDINIALDVVSTEIDECICVEDCVWPGDANGDGKVSILDALSVGRFMGQGGAARDEAPYGEIYEGVSVEDWLGNQVNGKNVKHVDTDGDGVITVEDLQVVVDNYGDINSVMSSDVLGVKNVPFLLSTTVSEMDSGDLVVIYVTMGTSEYPAIDVQGVAFAVNLPASLVDSSTVEVEYLEDGYLVKDAPYIDLTHQPVDGIIHTTGVKTNSAGSTGFGVIATVSFIIEEDAEGIKNPGRSSAQSNGDVVATINATDIIIEDSRGFKYALPNTSLDLTVKSGEDGVLNDPLNVYPNPAGDLVTIESMIGAELSSINIFSADGALIRTVGNLKSSRKVLDISDLPDGMYIIKAADDKQVYTSKLIKK